MAIDISRKYAGLAGICIASFLGCIDLTVVNTVLPAIGKEFAAPLRDTQWITSAFMIALSAFMVPAGGVADKYGRKRVLLTGLALFGAASLIVGVTTHFAILVLFRFVQGIGCAILYTVSGAIITYLFNDGERGKALGILFAVNGLGLAAGPVIGGLFSGLIDWRYAFLINIPFILISLWLCARYLPEQKSVQARGLDIPGCLLLIGALISLVSYFSLELSPGNGRYLLRAAVLLSLLFIFHELKTPQPIVEFHFFRKRTFIAALAATFFLAFYYCAVLLSLPLFLANVSALNDLQIGLLLLPATVTFALVSAWVGNSSERIGPQKLIICGLLLFILSGACLAPAMASHRVWLLIIPLLFFGAGWGAILGPSTLVALRALPDDRAAVAMGTSWTVHNIGGACGITFAVSVIGDGAQGDSGYRMLMYLLAVLAGAVAGICLFLGRR